MLHFPKKKSSKFFVTSVIMHQLARKMILNNYFYKFAYSYNISYQSCCEMIPSGTMSQVDLQ